MRRTDADYALNPGPLSAEEFERMVIKDWKYQTSFTISRENGKWVARNWLTGDVIAPNNLRVMYKPDGEGEDD